jgi:hypothetical protein
LKPQKLTFENTHISKLMRDQGDSIPCGVWGSAHTRQVKKKPKMQGYGVPCLYTRRFFRTPAVFSVPVLFFPYPRCFFRTERWRFWLNDGSALQNGGFTTKRG